MSILIWIFLFFFFSQVDGEPRPAIYWKRDNQILINDEKYQILSSGTLKILRIELDDQGDYVCIGKNDIGESQTTAKLNVKGKWLKSC